MNLKSMYGACKKVAVGVVAICGLINVVFMTALAGGQAGPSHFVAAPALLLLSCGLPIVPLLRQLRVSTSLAIFTGAMIANGAVLGVMAFPSNAFALLAVVAAGAAAIVLTLGRADQPAAETPNRL